jgi:UDP-N-acetylmuramoyl-L-alanyl-D-glutamate--2,6-diaminopimelate ligase
MPLPGDPTVGMSLAALLGDVAGKHGAIDVQGLQLDSRLLQSGDAFLALPGEVNDGRDHIQAAVAAGAAAIIAESGLTESQRSSAGSLPLVEVAALNAQLGAIAARFFDFPSCAMHVVGITGTNGKTTTSRLLAQLLRAEYQACGVIGTLGATLTEHVSDARNTTPDAIRLQAQLAQWRDQRVAHAVLEVSSHSLVQGRVNALEFDTAVFTNLTHDHLDYHGDMRSYGVAKSQLFQSAALKVAILNMDDDYASSIRHMVAPTTEVIGYSVAGVPAAGAPVAGIPAAVVAREIHYHDNGLEARIETPWGEGILRSPLAGDFNLSNLLAAISAACVAGMSLQKILQLAPLLQGVAGRMEYVANDRRLQLVVDYAHTPDALRQALLALRAHVRGELICVFGCGGDRDAHKRPLMGRIASENADRVIITSDNPRSESPLAIIEDIERGTSGRIEIEVNRAAAIALAVSTAAPGDCILVAGKGHESYQQIGSQRSSFSDVEQLRLAVTGGGAA